MLRTHSRGTLELVLCVHTARGWDQPGSRYRDQTEQLPQSGGKFGSVEPSTHLLPWPYNGTEEGTESS